MKRRDFTKRAGLGTLGLSSIPLFGSAMNYLHDAEDVKKIPLGICNHSIRAMRPNATQLIEYAIDHRLDSVIFNTLTPFESREKNYLKKVKQLAVANDISIYVGVGSISELSARFSDQYGNAKALLQKGIRVASALGSPIVGVRIGVLEDRYTEGGIAPKIEEVISHMKSFRQQMLDAGLKFSFENHAGDMRSEELLALIDETGSDICGAFFDPGNAIYAMEDPIKAMQALSKHIITCQARDVVIWPTDEGATFQWTAVGEGMMDFKYYTKYLAEHCPGVPIHLETISNSPRQIPYLTSEYWKGFPDLNASGIIDFLKLVRQGRPIEFIETPPGADKKAFDLKLQKAEVEKSVKYLRENCNVGLKSADHN
jgi:sugar phosphate isomerase/epimerase